MPEDSNRLSGPKYEAQALFIMENGQTHGEMLAQMKAQDFNSAYRSAEEWANRVSNEIGTNKYVLMVFERGHGKVVYRNVSDASFMP